MSRSLSHGVGRLVILTVPAVLFLLHSGGGNLFAQQTTLTGQENNSITLSTAVKLTKNFQATAAPSTEISEYFGKTIFQFILSQDGCIGVRIYYGKKDDGNPALVLVGVNASGQDMTAGTIGELGFPCPPYCDTTKTLGQ